MKHSSPLSIDLNSVFSSVAAKVKPSSAVNNSITAKKVT
jgi:hypothetical protein